MKPKRWHCARQAFRYCALSPKMTIMRKSGAWCAKGWSSFSPSRNRWRGYEKAHLVKFAAELFRRPYAKATMVRLPVIPNPRACGTAKPCLLPSMAFIHRKTPNRWCYRNATARAATPANPILTMRQCVSVTMGDVTEGLGRVYNSADKHLSRCANCSSPSGRGIGVRAQPIEKVEFRLINNIAHPLPNPPPLRASPCRGGGFFKLQTAPNAVL